MPLNLSEIGSMFKSLYQPEHSNPSIKLMFFPATGSLKCSDCFWLITILHSSYPYKFLLLISLNVQISQGVVLNTPKDDKDIQLVVLWKCTRVTVLVQYLTGVRGGASFACAPIRKALVVI